MESWPIGFPNPSESFSINVGGNSIRTPMDSGLVRQRRRFTTEYVTVRSQWEFDDLQMGVFIAFHKQRINLGNDWFLMPLPVGGVGLVEQAVRFVEGKYDQSYVPVGFWQVSATLEVDQRAVIDDGLLDFYLTLGFSPAELQNLIAIVNGFHNCVHHTLPTNLN